MKMTMLVMLAALLSTAFASAPDTLWTRTYGGANDDVGRSMQLTADGGCIIAGWTRSFGAGGSDVWLLKTDPQGDTQWTRTYGGPLDDEAYSVDLTFDGGYIVAGTTKSFGADVWLLKVSASGDTQWSRTYGGSWDAGGYSVRQAADSGYVIAGWMDVGTDYDGWMVKCDALGDTVWTRRPDHVPTILGVREAPNGDFLLVGPSPVQYGLHWRTDPTGNVLWKKDLSNLGTGGVVPRPGNGSIVVGEYMRLMGESLHIYLALMALDSMGNVESWGGLYSPPTSYAFGRAVEEADDGYIAVGECDYYERDVYLVRVNLNGDSLWTKVIGGDSEDIGYSCQQTADSGFVVAGTTRSFGAGGTDVWLIRLEPEQIGIQETPSAKRQTTNAGATVMRRLPIGAVVFDAMGRRAANPKPGVYFIREGLGTRGEGLGKTRKAVVTR